MFMKPKPNLHNSQTVDRKFFQGANENTNETSELSRAPKNRTSPSSESG